MEQASFRASKEFGNYKGRGMNNLIACFLQVDFLYYVVRIGSIDDVFHYM